VALTAQVLFQRFFCKRSFTRFNARVRDWCKTMQRSRAK
jgi:hypothetical protein